MALYETVLNWSRLVKQGESWSYSSLKASRLAAVSAPECVLFFFLVGLSVTSHLYRMGDPGSFLSRLLGLQGLSAAAAASSTHTIFIYFGI